MNTLKANWLALGAICIFFVLICLAGLASDFVTGLLRSGIDGIMLLAVCLLIAGVFALMLLMVLHQAGLLPALGKPAAKPPKPGSPAAS